MIDDEELEKLLVEAYREGFRDGWNGFVRKGSKSFFRKKIIKKTFVYRFFSVLTDFIVTYAFTGALSISVSVALTCIIIHTSLYYLIEKSF